MYVYTPRYDRCIKIEKNLWRRGSVWFTFLFGTRWIRVPRGSDAPTTRVSALRGINLSAVVPARRWWWKSCCCVNSRHKSTVVVCQISILYDFFFLFYFFFNGNPYFHKLIEIHVHTRIFTRILMIFFHFFPFPFPSLSFPFPCTLPSFSRSSASSAHATSCNRAHDRTFISMGVWADDDDDRVMINSTVVLSSLNQSRP